MALPCVSFGSLIGICVAGLAFGVVPEEIRDGTTYTVFMTVGIVCGVCGGLTVAEILRKKRPNPN